MSLVCNFRYRQTQAQKTRILQRGQGHFDVEVGKDFEHRFDLKSERGKRLFYEELKKVNGGTFTDYQQHRRAMDDMRKGIDQFGLNNPRSHQIRFGS